MTGLLVWRHGRPRGTLSGRVQGQTDVDLDEIGVAQAAAAAPRAGRPRDPTLIVSSDLRRAASHGGARSAELTGLPVQARPAAAGARLRAVAGPRRRPRSGTRVSGRLPAAGHRRADHEPGDRAESTTWPTGSRPPCTTRPSRSGTAPRSWSPTAARPGPAARLLLGWPVRRPGTRSRCWTTAASPTCGATRPGAGSSMAQRGLTGHSRTTLGCGTAARR